MIDAIISLLIVAGGAFTLIGSIGLLRLRDVFQRMHAPTKATTLGVGFILIAAAISTTVDGQALSVQELLITFLLFVTAPVSAYLLARVALHRGDGDRRGLDPAEGEPGSTSGGADPSARQPDGPAR